MTFLFHMLCHFLSKDNERAQTCVVCMIHHVNEAFMMWKTGISVRPLLFCVVTGTWSLLLLLTLLYAVQGLQACSKEANSLSYHASYFKPRVSTGTYIDIVLI